MLVIRFLRAGKKNQPFFKIVVAEKEKSSTSGRFIEEVGFYNPLTKEKNLKAERIKYWISVGAQPSETMHNLLISQKIIEGKKIASHKKSKKKEEVVEEKVAAPAEAPVVEEKPVAETPEIKEVKPEETEKPKEEEKKEEKVVEEVKIEPAEEKKEEKKE